MAAPKESKEGVQKSVSTTLVKDKTCKSCIRFVSQASTETVTTSLYLQNAAWEALGKPESVTLTVAPITG